MALALVAVPFALVLLLVEEKWVPLLRADVGTSERLHDYALTSAGFVRAMALIRDSGSALAWQLVLGAVVLWLLWRRLPRLALFVVITAGSSLLNSVVKISVHRGAVMAVPMVAVAWTIWTELRVGPSQQCSTLGMPVQWRSASPARESIESSTGGVDAT